MNSGEVVRMKTAKLLFGNAEVRGEASFRAPKGKRIAFIVLGSEDDDGTNPIDAEEMLRSWGFSKESAAFDILRDVQLWCKLNPDEKFSFTLAERIDAAIPKAGA